MGVENSAGMKVPGGDSKRCMIHAKIDRRPIGAQLRGGLYSPVDPYLTVVIGTPTFDGAVSQQCASVQIPNIQTDRVAGTEVNGGKGIAHFAWIITDVTAPANREHVVPTVAPTDGLVVGPDGAGRFIRPSSHKFDGLADVDFRQAGTYFVAVVTVSVRIARGRSAPNISAIHV